MACECIKTVTEKLKNAIEPQTGFDDQTSSFNKALMLSETNNPGFSLDFVTEGTKTAKTGRVQNKKNIQKVFLTFCPFCGIKYDE